MKKMILSAVALLGTFAALAQEPTTSPAPQPAPKHVGKTKLPKTKKEKAEGQKMTPVNHGQAVSAVATTTPLAGADKGAAISTVARSEAKAPVGSRPARTARGERSHGSHAGGSGHAHAGGHQTGHGRR